MKVRVLPVLFSLSFASVSVFAQSSGSDRLSVETTGNAKKEKTPIDMNKVNENLNKITQKIQQQNSGFLSSVELNLQEKNNLVKKSLLLTMAVKGKIFNELGIQGSLSDLNLVATNVDAAEISGRLKVNGYALAKKILSTPSKYASKEETSEQVIEKNLKRGQEACERAAKDQ